MQRTRRCADRSGRFEMTEVKDVLGRHVPLRAELEPEWGDVLERAGRRKRRRLLPALAAAGGLAAAALVAVALWPSGGRPLTVLERARAAVGDGPVTRLVYRDELGETLVNLASGERRPIYGDHEEWFDASR